MRNYPNLLRNFYRGKLPLLWQQKIDIIRGESQVFKSCFAPTKSIFIHVPKAAGTSIARSIYGINVGHRSLSDYAKISERELAKYFTFTFVRNPWDRTVSEYNFVQQGGTKYVQPIENPIYKSHYFKDFDTFVNDWLPSADLCQEDVVFAPQYWYTRLNGKDVATDYTCKVENLNDGIDYLRQRLNISMTIEKLNASQRNKNYRDYYSPQTVDIVSRIYARDIDLFDYKFEN